MQRRSFLAASGLAASSPLLHAAVAGATLPPSTTTTDDAASSPWIDFIDDGLALPPSQYAARLLEETQASGFIADYYSNGGAIEALEARFAQALGKQAAMFVPTGTLANHLALRTLAGSDRRVLVQAESHVYNDSGDAAQALSGLNLVPLATGQATMPLEEIRRWVERSARGRVETPIGAISIESPVRRRDHAMFDPGELERVCAFARERGIRLHLDGARMFNLPQHCGRSVKRIAALFDTVYVSLWKHFNAASGAILAGDSALIDGLFHARRMFGGSLPHAWPQAVVAARYLDGYEQSYAQAWKVAEALFEALEKDARFRVRRIAGGTSRVFLALDGVAAEAFSVRLGAQRIRLTLPPGASEFPLQVNASLANATSGQLARAFIDAAGA